MREKKGGDYTTSAGKEKATVTQSDTSTNTMYHTLQYHAFQWAAGTTSPDKPQINVFLTRDLHILETIKLIVILHRKRPDIVTSQHSYTYAYTRRDNPSDTVGRNIRCVVYASSLSSLVSSCIGGRKEHQFTPVPSTHPFILTSRRIIPALFTGLDCARWVGGRSG